MGGNNCASGVFQPSKIPEIIKDLVAKGFHHKPEENPHKGEKCYMSRKNYAATYGPTKGDRVRLGDTNLYVEIEKDFTVYGDECKFGGGKVLREGMGQSSGMGASQVLDTVITNAIVIDYTGIYKADIGIKNGKICGIGKAGNPDVMDGVDNNLVVGVNTEAIAGEGLILTAGGVDTHVHFICPQVFHMTILILLHP